MACTWCLFGVVVGIITLPPGHDFVATIAGMLAGTIVLVPLGLVLGLVGGQPSLTLWGGVTGAGVSALLGVAIQNVDLARLAPLALIGGAIAGATLPMATSSISSLGRLLVQARRSR